MNPYRTPGAMFYVPRRKAELIDMIVKAGWAGTKTALRSMEHRQLKKILIDKRQAHFDKFMIKDIPQTHTQTNEVNDE